MVADYLYPLEQTGREFVVDGRAATPETMTSAAVSGVHSGFLLSAGMARVERGDQIWFRAGAPEQRIVALGIVQAAAYEGTDDGRWRVAVALDPVATRRLQQTLEQPFVRAVRQAVWTALADEAAALRKIAMV